MLHLRLLKGLQDLFYHILFLLIAEFFSKLPLSSPDVASSSQTPHTLKTLTVVLFDLPNTDPDIPVFLRPKLYSFQISSPPILSPPLLSPFPGSWLRRDPRPRLPLLLIPQQPPSDFSCFCFSSPSPSLQVNQTDLLNK